MAFSFASSAADFYLFIFYLCGIVSVWGPHKSRFFPQVPPFVPLAVDFRVKMLLLVQSFCASDVR